MKILFLCTGNTCRSVLAHQYAAKLAADAGMELEVLSAGLAASEDIPQPMVVKRLLMKEGVTSYEHTPKMFSCPMAAEVSLILAMTAAQKDAVTGLCPGAAGKTYTLTEYAGLGGDDIPDPFGREDFFYFTVFKTIKTAVQAVIEHLKKG